MAEICVEDAPCCLPFAMGRMQSTKTQNSFRTSNARQRAVPDGQIKVSRYTEAAAPPRPGIVTGE